MIYVNNQEYYEHLFFSVFLTKYIKNGIMNMLPEKGKLCLLEITGCAR